MNEFTKNQKDIENTVLSGYQKIENKVVSSYKRIEDSFVDGYKKIEDSSVKKFLMPNENASRWEEQPSQSKGD